MVVVERTQAVMLAPLADKSHVLADERYEVGGL